MLEIEVKFITGNPIGQSIINGLRQTWSFSFKTQQITIKIYSGAFIYKKKR